MENGLQTNPNTVIEITNLFDTILLSNLVWNATVKNMYLCFSLAIIARQFAQNTSGRPFNII